MVQLALYQPDIPQNLGSAIRLCACLDTPLDVIEPCGFPWNDRKIRQSGMDYMDAITINRHSSWDRFFENYHGKQRIILMTTKSPHNFTEFTFQPDDILLAGRESSGVPDDIHACADGRVIVPLKPGLRSFNIINASAMILSEALRQTDGFPKAE